MTAAPNALIDVVIAVHDLRRPIRRAVESVIRGSQAADVRAVVVAHGISAAKVQAELAGLPQTQVTVLEFSDGVPSPAGPFNFGLKQSSAPYVTIMGSDDSYEPGFGARYAAYLRRTPVDVLIPPLRHAGGRKVLAPLPRWARKRGLQARRDRLFYRTAPLAILARPFLESAGFGLREGFRTGEDIALGVWAWTQAQRIDFARGLPAYVIGDDAEERSSHVVREFAELAAPLDDLFSMSWMHRLSLPTRRALAAKIARVSVLGPLRSAEGAIHSDADLAALTALLRRLNSFAPGFTGPLARAEEDALQKLEGCGSVVELEAVRSAYLRASAVEVRVPRQVWRMFAAESPLGRTLDGLLSR